jgi:hypothetical protein
MSSKRDSLDGGFYRDMGIEQGGMFLQSPIADVLGYTPDEGEQELLKAAEEHYLEVASLAALASHPGYIKIMKIIDRMVKSEYEEIENLMRSNEATVEKTQMNLYAAMKLKDFKSELVTKVSEYHNRVKEAGSGEEEEA